MQPVFEGGLPPPTGASRADFIRSAYSHLAGAMVSFVALSTALHLSGIGGRMLTALGGHRLLWLALLGAFMVVGWLATWLADRAESNRAQLVGLGIYVLAEALIFAPMFTLASLISSSVVPAAGAVTMMLVAALTWTAFTTKTNFSFLGGFLRVAGFVAIGVIVAGTVLGFSLGIWFSGLMVLFAGACVLYDTSRIIHEYPTDRPAGAALHLFASIALLLWYVLRILISLSSSDD